MEGELLSKVHMACLNPQVSQSWVIILWKYIALAIPLNFWISSHWTKKETQKEKGRGDRKCERGGRRVGRAKDEEERKERILEGDTHTQRKRQREKIAQEVNRRTEVIRRVRQMWGSGGHGERNGHLMTYKSSVPHTVIWRSPWGPEEGRTDTVRSFPLYLTYLRERRYGTAVRSVTMWKEGRYFYSTTYSRFFHPSSFPFTQWALYFDIYYVLGIVAVSGNKNEWMKKQMKSPTWHAQQYLFCFGSSTTATEIE